MKEWYTLDELLESCGITKSQYIKPNLTWDTLTFQDMIDYYHANGNSESMMDALVVLGELMYLRISGDDSNEVSIGELWYDREDFTDMTLEEFEDFIGDYVDRYFELHTYLSYTITNIHVKEEYNYDLDFDGYRVVAYGNLVEVNTWNFEIKKIYKKFFL